MATNRYFKPYDYNRERNLLQGLVVESIKTIGFDVKYIPRTIVERDDLYGEAVLSKFESAPAVEMYVKSTEGFEGEGDTITRFGLEIRDAVTFTIARKRWLQIRNPKVTDEVGYNIHLEGSDLYDMENMSLLQLEDGGVSNLYNIDSDRPREGDLIWWHEPSALFEIKFVEHEAQFYQSGVVHSYDLRCEMFVYSSERFNTGVADIDSIENDYSMDVMDWKILLESGDVLVMEHENHPVIQEVFSEVSHAGLWTTKHDLTANNQFFLVNSAPFVDLSETNPFLTR